MNNSVFTANWRMVLVGAIVLTGVLVGLTITLTGDRTLNPSNPFWFVALIVLFGMALTLIAMMFRWMDLANADEAFALPAGSIRTLLAIGIMVLFTVFGLTFFDKAGGDIYKLSEKPVEEVDAPLDPAERRAEIARYKELGFAAVVASLGSASAPAKLKLYRIDVTPRSDVTDTKKQILTAVITLLTTVVGFYFGSRSAESARDKADRANGALPPAVQQPAADLKQLDDDIAQATDHLKNLKAETAPAGKEADMAKALSNADLTANQLKKDRDTLALDLADVSRTVPENILVDRIASLRKTLNAFNVQLKEADGFVAAG